MAAAGWREGGGAAGAPPQERCPARVASPRACSITAAVYATLARGILQRMQCKWPPPPAAHCTDLEAGKAARVQPNSASSGYCGGAVFFHALLMLHTEREGGTKAVEGRGAAGHGALGERWTVHCRTHPLRSRTASQPCFKSAAAVLHPPDEECNDSRVARRPLAALHNAPRQPLDRAAIHAQRERAPAREDALPLRRGLGVAVALGVVSHQAVSCRLGPQRAWGWDGMRHCARRVPAAAAAARCRQAERPGGAPGAPTQAHPPYRTRSKGAALLFALLMAVAHSFCCVRHVSRTPLSSGRSHEPLTGGSCSAAAAATRGRSSGGGGLRDGGSRAWRVGASSRLAAVPMRAAWQRRRPPQAAPGAPAPLSADPSTICPISQCSMLSSSSSAWPGSRGAHGAPPCKHPWHALTMLQHDAGCTEAAPSREAQPALAATPREVPHRRASAGPANA